MSQRRYELSDFEWMIIEPLLPNKPRGKPRADDRKVLNGIYWRLRPWMDSVRIRAALFVRMSFGARLLALLGRGGAHACYRQEKMRKAAAAGSPVPSRFHSTALLADLTTGVAA